VTVRSRNLQYVADFILRYTKNLIKRAKNINKKTLSTRLRSLTKNAEGFTLVELIVVIAILAVLGGVAAPDFGGRHTILLINPNEKQATLRQRAKCR
jgi:prepilin-type N-terminal cleavage/methylation domain-containing protein